MKNSYFRRNRSINRFILLLGSLIFINIIAAKVFTRLDLTKEKKYSLTPQTKTLLKNLDSEVLVKVYLDGEFPAGFKRLQTSIKDILDEFQVYGDENIIYEFINPSESGNEKEKFEFYKQLSKKGLTPMNLQVREDEALVEQYVFPGALVTYKGRELPVVFLNNQVGLDPQVALNGSIAMLEYKLSNVIQKLQHKSRPKIAFTEGHGELADIYMQDIGKTLSEFYEINRFDPTKNAAIDTSLKALIIARPSVPYTEREKWMLDQYVMMGGKILWLVEPVIAEMDSMKSIGKNKDGFTTVDMPLNLEDLFFRYGVRYNTDLIQDMQCNQIPIVVGMQNNTPQTKNFEWIYYPVIAPQSDHPIVKNLDLINTEFVSSIDTVKTSSSIQKTVLLSSSAYSRSVFAPHDVSLSVIQNKVDAKQFNKKNLPVAVLCEGVFSSAFSNRLSDETTEMMDTIYPYEIKSTSSPTKMIFLSDAAFIKNPVKSDSTTMPLGYYKFTQQTFANKDFIINCMEYLVDESGLIYSRAKDVKLRLLDKAKVNLYRTEYQVLNIVFPLFLLLLAGIGFYVYRTRKYAR